MHSWSGNDAAAAAGPTVCRTEVCERVCMFGIIIVIITAIIIVIITTSSSSSIIIIIIIIIIAERRSANAQFSKERGRAQGSRGKGLGLE